MESADEKTVVDNNNSNLTTDVLDSTDLKVSISKSESQDEKVKISQRMAKDAVKFTRNKKVCECHCGLSKNYRFHKIRKLSWRRRETVPYFVLAKFVYELDEGIKISRSTGHCGSFNGHRKHSINEKQSAYAKSGCKCWVE